MIDQHVDSRNAVRLLMTSNTIMSPLHMPSRSQLNRRRTYFAFSFIAGESGQYVSGPFDANRRSDTRHADVIVNSRKRSSGGGGGAALATRLVSQHFTVLNSI